jgi:hypothetical protein
MKSLAWLTGVGTLVMAGIYMVVSLNRWEWNRALFFGLVVLIAEVALATALVLRQLSQLRMVQPTDPNVIAILRAARPPRHDRFAWMRRSVTQMQVFITFAIGGGVIVSAFAALVDRVGAVTATPQAEQHLARRLDAIAYPRAGLFVDDITALAQDDPGADDVQLQRILGSWWLP